MEARPVRIRVAGPRLTRGGRELRERIFCGELGLPAEVLGYDEDGVHVVAIVDDGPVETVVGAARLVEREAAQGEQICVDPAFRGQGIGVGLLASLESEALRRGHMELELEAVDSAVPFYVARGYGPVGAPFEAHGKPHQRMRRSLCG